MFRNYNIVIMYTNAKGVIKMIFFPQLLTGTHFNGTRKNRLQKYFNVCTHVLIAHYIKFNYVSLSSRINFFFLNLLHVHTLLMSRQTWRLFEIKVKFD